MTTQAKVFSAALLVQVIILLGMPAYQYSAAMYGHSVYLRVAPVDPLSVLSGYYAQLRYDIAAPVGIDEFDKLPDGTGIYTVLVPTPEGVSRAERMELTPPILHGNEHMIYGTKKGDHVAYAGIEERHINEDARDDVDRGLRDSNADCRAEVRLDAHGNPSMHGLHIGNKKY